MSVTFTVPGKVPSKANFRHANTARAKAQWKRILDYQAEVGMSALAAGSRKHLGKGKARVKVLLVNQSCDLDNALKCPIDGLKNVAFPDDSGKYLGGVHVSWAEDDGPPRAEYRIEWGDSEFLRAADTFARSHEGVLRQLGEQ